MKKQKRRNASSKKNASSGSPTEFHCHAPDAAAVSLAGSFNDWNPEACPMNRGDDAIWHTSLELPAGRYEFKFVVDGQWCCEPGIDEAHSECANCVTNEFGTMNLVLEIGTT